MNNNNKLIWHYTNNKNLNNIVQNIREQFQTVIDVKQKIL